MALTPATLQNILLTGNTLGVAIHEHGRALRNYMVFDLSNTRSHFMHGRDALKPDARYDRDGRVIVELDSRDLVTKRHPFSDEAVETIKESLDSPTLQQRKGRMLPALELVPQEHIEKAVIDRLEREVPGAGIRQLYEDAHARQTAEREEIRKDPRAYVERMFDEMLQGNGISLDDTDAMRGLMRAMAVQYANRGMPQLLNAIGERDDFDPKQHLKLMLRMRTAREEQKLEEPMRVLEDVGPEIINRICEHRHCNLGQGGTYFREQTDQAVADIYDECAADARLRMWVYRKFLREPVTRPMVDDLIQIMERYQYDPEQAENLKVGVLLAESDAARLVHENPEALMERGRHQRALHILMDYARDMGNPFSGRLTEEANRVSQEIVEAVPAHILEQATRDGVPLMVDVGDPSHTTQMQAGDMSLRGAYSYNKFGVPAIRLSPDLLGALEFEEAGGLGRFARHEYRHYWADRGGFMDDVRLPAAVEQDKAHFAKVWEAVDSDDAAGEALRKEAATVLGTEDKAALRNRLRVIRKINDAWLDMPQEGGAVPKLPDNYATRMEKLEETFSRVDEVVMEYGDKAAAFLFPASHGLLQEMDGAFATRVNEQTLPALPVAGRKTGRKK